MTTGGEGERVGSRYRGAIVLGMDLFLIFSCNCLVFLPSLLREDVRAWNLFLHIALLAVCMLVFQLPLHTYNSLWRYAESREYLVLLSGMGLGYLLYTAVNVLAGMSLIWISCALTGTALALLLMLAIRFCYRLYRYRVSTTRAEGRSYVAILGAGATGVALLRELRGNPDGRYLPWCLLDDAPDKRDKTVDGVPVWGPIDRLPELLRNTPVTELVIAMSHLEGPRRREILDCCARTSCRIHILDDPLAQLQRGRPMAGGMRQVQIEDLLGRDPVELDTERVRALLRGRTVMVTGGGGSIGSELCRQIAGQAPRRLIVVDIAENSTYELQSDLRARYGGALDLRVEIASVRDRRKLDVLFAQYRPEVVFHAAAHKHVPLMERCPEEAVKNNVFGTYHTALAARKYGTETFVLISTDKAVNPTNIMGATKYLCEQVLQGLRGQGTTRFAAVRFGNVLGSSGSVIPLFKRQIERGGPVTVTDKQIIRYFMTIPEAVELVLEAGALAESGEVFVLDMGEPVRILDLAEKLIRLSGYTPYVDIQIEEVGLRPGEKLYEELLTASGDLHRTPNRKILVETRPPLDEAELERWLGSLRAALATGRREAIFAQLHALVPTFRDPDEVNREAVRQREDEEGAYAVSPAAVEVRDWSVPAK